MTNLNTIRQAENKIRDLINWAAVMSNEELRVGEGKKIEADTAKILKSKLQEISAIIGRIK